MNEDTPILARSLRKFLLCAKGDWIGLAPMAAHVGDVICILHGCSVPVLLRRNSDYGTERIWWNVVGECYVHGIMDGEAVNLSGPDNSETFELR